MDALCCPICQEPTARIDTVAVSELAVQYERQFSIDICGEFAGITEIHLNRCPVCDFAFFSPAQAGSNQFYEQLQEHAWYYLEDKPEYATARRHVQPTDRVLDVGCGSGAFAKGHPTANYVGLEYTDAAVMRARERGLTVLKQSIESHALAVPASYDVVCAFQVLEHVTNPRAFIEACVDACRPRGKIIFATPNADAFVEVVKNCVLNFPPHHMARFSRRAWINFTNYFPLRMVEIVEQVLEPVHYRLYAKTLVQASFEKLLHFGPPKYVDSSFRNRVLGKLSDIGGRILVRGLADPRLQPKGQSVTAVYEKL